MVSCYDCTDAGGRVTQGAVTEARLCGHSGSMSNERNTADGRARFALREAIKYAIAVLQPLEMAKKIYPCPFPADCALLSLIWWTFLIAN